MSNNDDFLQFETCQGLTVEVFIQRVLTDLNRKVAAQITTWMAEPTDENVERSFEYLKDYFQAVAPSTYEVLTQPQLRMTHRHFVESVVMNGIYLYFPDGKVAIEEAALRAAIKRFGQLA